MKFFLSLLLLMASLPFSAESQDEPAVVAGKNIAIVQTEYGAVRGYIHHGIFTFKGIPYGEAGRFLPAQKPAPWKGVRSSMAYGPVCPGNQGPVLSDEYEFPFNRNRGYYSNENCLNLNIWTKKTGKGEKKPVMVWIHGGGFSSGSAVEFPSYDGENLSRKGDVVVVSINHRLNILGFLDLSAYGAKYNYSGNVGAMDMVLALTWVKENISHFGGDPGNVTIFGQSGGGAKVMCLMNTPSAKGLFQKAIVQSGSYLTHFTEDSIARKVSAALLEILEIGPDQVDSLQKIPYAVLEAAGQQALAQIKKTTEVGEVTVFGLDWEPVHDGDFLPYQPNEAAALELSKDIPLLVGSCKNEYNPFNPATRDLSMEDVRARLEKKYGERAAAYMAAVKAAYPETVKPSDYLDVDLLFRPMVIGEADQKVLYGSASVYMYLFAWQSPVLDGIFKAYHNMDLPFVFNNIGRCEEMTGGGKEAYLLADKVSGAWASFAHSGNPNHKGLPPWSSYTPGNGAVMIFDRENQVKHHHDKELLAIGMGK